MKREHQLAGIVAARRAWALVKFLMALVLFLIFFGLAIAAAIAIFGNEAGGMPLPSDRKFYWYLLLGVSVAIFIPSWQWAARNLGVLRSPLSDELQSATSTLMKADAARAALRDAADKTRAQPPSV